MGAYVGRQAQEPTVVSKKNLKDEIKVLSNSKSTRILTGTEGCVKFKMH